jgi:hypothetical protein
MEDRHFGYRQKYLKKHCCQLTSLISPLSAEQKDDKLSTQWVDDTPGVWSLESGPLDSVNYRIGNIHTMHM